VLQKSVIEKTSLGVTDSVQEPCTYLALIVVDEQARIQLSFWNTLDGDDIKDLLCADGARLRPEFETAIRELASNPHRTAFDSRVLFRDRGRTLRLSPLAGNEDTRFALVMEADRHDGTLTRAASRYRLTRRQTEVLALVLEGASASDVAHSLVISEYTAQGYIKTLLAKTSCRNRAALVARVLNWNSPRAAPLGAAAFDAEAVSL
jgi:DNA-binding CsgD family transcriptional regulator